MKVEKKMSDPVEVKEAFKDEAGYEYDEYAYLEGYRPDSEWNESLIVDGIHVMPRLPDAFDSYPNDERPGAEIADWWELPFITVHPIVTDNQLKIRYDVRCLDGGAWDRSTCRAYCWDFQEALAVAKDIKLARKI